jgi:hypothetical protein
MYFLVTQEMANEALAYINAKCPKYGIMYFKHRNNGISADCIGVLKTARILRPKGVDVIVRDRVASRMASEIIGLRNQIETYQNNSKSK